LRTVLAGMTLTLDELCADFSGITDVVRLHIQNAVHKVYVALGEEFTEVVHFSLSEAYRQV
jgi:serine protease inhibitor